MLPVKEYPAKRCKKPCSSSSLPVISPRNFSQRGHSPPGATPVILVKYCAGSCSNMFPERRSIIPPGVFERPQVSIPYANCLGMSPVSPSKLLDCRNSFCAGDLHRRSLIGQQFGARDATDSASEAEGHHCGVDQPTLSGPPQPLSPACDVAQFEGVLVGKP